MRVLAQRVIASALLAWMAHQVPAGAAGFDLSDGRTGMSCEHYESGARLAWLRRGGDWRDADDVTHGERAFVTQNVSNTGQPQTVSWDVTALARLWTSRPGPTGVFIRQLANQGSSVRFHSREATHAPDRPRLLVEWDDGSRNEWEAEADATMTCTSLSGKGSNPSLEVGNQRSAVLVFPFAARRGANVRKAELVLASDKQFGRASALGVFRLYPPSSEVGAVKQGLAAGFTMDSGIGSHRAVVFATGFESRDWEGEWSSNSSSSMASLTRRGEGNRYAALSGNALKVVVQKDKKTGLNLLYRFKDKTGTEPEEMYFRYYLRLGDDWVPKAEGKLPGFAGTYGKAGWGGRQSNGSNGWSARGRYAMSPGLAEGEYALGSYVYHAQMSKKYGDGWGWNLGQKGVLERNRWYSIEQRVKLNRPGNNDGVLQSWVDGVLVFERNDIRFRETAELRIETLWMNVYHGGTTKAPQDLSVYIDNVVIATEYIGPASGVRTAAQK